MKTAPFCKTSFFSTKYEAFEVLGKGKFGVVKRCKDKETGAILAAKYIQKTGESKKETLREIQMMNKLHHKRLIQLYDAYENRKEMVLVMELVSGGELFEKVVADDNLTEKQVVRYMKQVLYGLQHMHHKNMVHLDLKPENIMCLGGGKSGYEEIKLIDYGMTRILDPDKPETAACGTAEFVAPEVLQLKPISVAADMWGIGVITYVLLSGLSPFMGDDDFETLQNVSEGEYDFEDDDEIFESISQEAKDFIEELLVLEPTDRNTVDDALNHQWFRNFESLSEKKLGTNKLKRFLIKRRWAKAIKVVLATNRFANGIFGGIGGKGKKGGFLESIKQQVAKEEEEEAVEAKSKQNGEGGSLANEDPDLAGNEGTACDVADKDVNEDGTGELKSKMKKASIACSSSESESGHKPP